MSPSPLSLSTCFGCAVQPAARALLRPSFNTSRLTCHSRPRRRFRRAIPCATASQLQSTHEEPTAPDDDVTSVEMFRVTDAEAGMRLDKLLSQRFTDKSRTYIQTLLTSSCVTLDSVVATTKSHRPSENQLVTVRFLPLQRDLPLTPENLPLDVVHEDAHLLVVNKPAGMVVHPAPGNWTGTLVHALCHHYPDIARQGGPRPGVVHRIDKGTSGLLAIARTPDAHAALTNLFASRQIRKRYVAITIGNPAGTGCTGRVIDAPIGRHVTDRLRMSILPVESGGRTAVSTVSTIAHDAAGFLHAVQVQIDTGRTHQIRVHCRHARAPVLGDEVYGAHDVNRRYAASATRPMLHAQRLTFTHPITGTEVDVRSRLADDMRRMMERVVYPDFEDEGW